MKKQLTICCPHIADEGPDTLIVEGGALTLSGSLALLRKSLRDFFNARDDAMHRLWAWSARPGSGKVLLLGHADCDCPFLIRLDGQETRAVLDALAHDLRNELLGQPSTEARLMELTAGRKRHHSGKETISPELLEALEQATRKSA